jgi:hypothetical protein
LGTHWWVESDPLLAGVPSCVIDECDGLPTFKLATLYRDSPQCGRSSDWKCNDALKLAAHR